MSEEEKRLAEEFYRRWKALQQTKQTTESESSQNEEMIDAMLEAYLGANGGEAGWRLADGVKHRYQRRQRQ